MSKLGKLILFAAREAGKEHQRRVKRYAHLKNINIGAAREEFESKFSHFRDPSPADDDWRYQAAKDFFNLNPPPRIGVYDLLYWSGKSKELELWELKRNMFEKFTGKMYKKNRSDW